MYVFLRIKLVVLHYIYCKLQIYYEHDHAKS